MQVTQLELTLEQREQAEPLRKKLFWQVREVVGPEQVAVPFEHMMQEFALL